MNDRKPDSALLPLVVQLGFAGSRRLHDAAAHPGIDASAFEGEIEKWLANRLQQLAKDLHLQSRHFLCGISAVAAGADTIFGRACRTNGIPQRLFLPQTRDEFLNAAGSDGPDFTPPQKQEAQLLLDSPHVIQERLVSDACHREERFEDVNREIVRVSDVLICLLREGSRGNPGGTEDLIARAAGRGKPVLVVSVGVAAGKPVFNEQWRLPAKSGDQPADVTEVLDLPTEPGTLAGVQMPVADAAKGLIEQYAAQIKLVSSATAARLEAKFRLMVKTIIGTHIVATILAAIAMGFASFHLGIIPVLLGLELVMLAAGFWTHRRLEHTRTARLWAEARLLAEVARSVLAVGNLHVYMDHLFSLPFPTTVRPLIRTINVLLLQSTRQDRTPWQAKRERYIQMRLMMPVDGQIDYYDQRTREAKRLLKVLRLGFIVCWITAFAATSTKLSLHGYMEEHATTADWLTGVMGTLAIVMPVLAAAALSLAAALDLEAQEHTYQEMLEFLRRQRGSLASATSERDYARLVLETESHLLGETTNWFSRRSFTGVA